MPNFDDSDDEQTDEDRKNGSLDINGAEDGGDAIVARMEPLPPRDALNRRFRRRPRRGEDTAYVLREFVQ